MISSQQENITDNNQRVNNTNISIRITNPYTTNNNTQNNNRKNKKQNKKIQQKLNIHIPLHNDPNNKKIKRKHRKIFIQPNSTLDKYFQYKINNEHYATDTTQLNTTTESENSAKAKRLRTNIFEHINPSSDSDSSNSHTSTYPTLTQLEFFNTSNSETKDRATKAFRCRLRRIIQRDINPKTKDEIKALKDKRQKKQEKKRKNNKNTETKRRKTTKLSKANEHHNEPWGDPSSIPPLQSYRFASNNVNGISYDSNCSDLQYICNRMDIIGADLVCIQETKLDTLQSRVRTTIQDTVKHMWRRTDVVTATSRINTGSINKLGGTMLITNTDMTSKITRRYSDAMGRWAATSYSCIQGKSITVISCYQVCEKTDTDPSKGDTTAYKQQQKMLRYENKIEDPRKHFKADLKTFVNALQQDDHYIILMGDFNDHMHKNQESFSAYIKDLKLVDPMTQFHNLEEEVSTYARGPNRVDFMFVSEEVLPFVNACGYDSFNENIFSDHRLMFMDIDKKLFNSENINQHERQQRGVNSANSKSIIKYVTKLHEQATERKFLEKLHKITSLETPNHKLVEDLDKELGKAMKYADSQCMHKYSEPFSEDILMARKKLKLYQLAISEKTLNRRCHNHINQLQQELLLPLDLNLTLSQL